MSPGEDWKLTIRKAIQRNALAFVAVFSSNSQARDKSYQHEELTLAVEQFRQHPPGRVWLIPVRLDDCALPDYDLGAGRTLDSLQRVDLFGEDATDEMIRLVTAVAQNTWTPSRTPQSMISVSPGAHTPGRRPR